MASFDADPAVVRRFIYDRVVLTGAAPTAPQVASSLDLTLDAATGAMRALADAHVLVLRPGDSAIAWAPPFSSIETPFQATANGRSYFAPCAWDAFGIPAALGTDGDITANCAWSAEPLACGVRHGRAYGDGVIHLLVPAAHFWDDIFLT